MPLDLGRINEAVAALLTVREKISRAFYNCTRRDKPERFEGGLYREIVKSTIIDKPALSFSRWSSSPTSFEVSRSTLDRKIRSKEVCRLWPDDT
jgi:hypothetical protein